MLNFLEKYNQLPYEIRDRVSSPEAMVMIAELEREYGVNLAIAVMRVMTKDVPVHDLPRFFVYEHEMEQGPALELAAKMKDRLFSRVGDYLGLAAPAQSEPETAETSAPAGNFAVASANAPDETGEAAQDSTAGSADVPDETEETGGESSKAQDPKPAAKAQSANFFFSPEDEEEIKALSEKLDTAPAAIDQSVREEEIITAALTKMPVNLSSGLLQNRLKQTLKTYIRGIRKRLEAKQSLLKPVEDGGVGLDLNAIEGVLFALDKEKAARLSETVMKAPPKIRVPEDALNYGPTSPDKPSAETKTAPVIGRDAAYDFSRFEKGDSKITETVPKTDNEDVKTAIDKEKPLTPVFKREEAKISKETAPPVIKPEASAVFNDNAVSKAEETPIKNSPAPPAVSVRRPAFQPSPTTGTGKKKMEDVKYVPKLTGPVDELKEMDLVNFRRLSDDPLSAVEKIKEKISVLEDENYAQRLAGIKAWRESPANNLYLTIGQESIAEGKPVSEIIAARSGAGEESLTEPEFLSIMDLNKELRF